MRIVPRDRPAAGEQMERRRETELGGSKVQKGRVDLADRHCKANRSGLQDPLELAPGETLAGEA
jgi:hypothetical protein